MRPTALKYKYELRNYEWLKINETYYTVLVNVNKKRLMEVTFLVHCAQLCFKGQYFFRWCKERMSPWRVCPVCAEHCLAGAQVHGYARPLHRVRRADVPRQLSGKLRFVPNTCVTVCEFINRHSDRIFKNVVNIISHSVGNVPFSVGLVPCFVGLVPCSVGLVSCAVGLVA